MGMDQQPRLGNQAQVCLQLPIPAQEAIDARGPKDEEQPGKLTTQVAAEDGEAFFLADLAPKIVKISREEQSVLEGSLQAHPLSGLRPLSFDPKVSLLQILIFYHFASFHSHFASPSLRKLQTTTLVLPCTSFALLSEISLSLSRFLNFLLRIPNTIKIEQSHG